MDVPNYGNTLSILKSFKSHRPSFQLVQYSKVHQRTLKIPYHEKGMYHMARNQSNNNMASSQVHNQEITENTVDCAILSLCACARSISNSLCVLIHYTEYLIAGLWEGPSHASIPRRPPSFHHPILPSFHTSILSLRVYCIGAQPFFLWCSHTPL